MPRLSRVVKYGLLCLCAAGALVVVAMTVGDSTRASHGEDSKASGSAREHSEGDGGEKEEAPGALEKQRYKAEAFPKRYVGVAENRGARRAAARVPRRLTAANFRRGALSRDGRPTAAALELPQPWAALGPAGGPLDPEIQRIQNELPVAAGRITALVVSPTCVAGDCRVWLGAAGGGVWRTNDGLADNPSWTSVDKGLLTQAIGSLRLDPNDATHKTIYAGTGEGNFSFGSQAGVGLYKSTNGGDSWALVPASFAVAANRSIRALAIDPTNPAVIWIGTAGGERGSKDQFDAVGPGPAVGVYKSTDGGATFAPEPSFPNDDVTGLEIDPSQHDTVYASTLGDGVYRSAPSIDGNSDWHKIFPSTTRSQVAVASHTRVWITDGSGPNENSAGEVYRVDNADQPFASVSATKVSTEANGASRFCGNTVVPQCDYDQVVTVDPDHPDTAWIGGSMDYHEVNDTGASNGRAVLRTLDGGQTWTDMTLSSSDQDHGIHPDIHAIVLKPSDPAVAFVGSDGGLTRTSGSYAAGGGSDRPAQKPCPDARCTQLVSSIPTQLFDLNRGLDTLQFNKLSVPANASGDLQGGTQDNGTWERSGAGGQWLETVGGDGGLSAFDATDPALRVRTGPGSSVEFSHSGGAAGTWHDATRNIAGDPSHFFIPLISDPRKHGNVFAATHSIYRNTDIEHADWDTIGDFNNAVRWSALARTPADTSTLWAGDGAGDVLVTKNADAPDPGDVKFVFATADVATPERFVSGITVDPADPNHAWVSYSGFDANTPAHPGHVFSVHYNPLTETATFQNISNGIGDQPVNDVAYDPAEGDLYASTDFGVLRLARGATTWARAAAGLPTAAVYGLTFSPQGRALYAATFGRGAYRLGLHRAPPDTAITSGPSGLSQEDVTFSFRATPAAGAAFTCKLDGRTAPCSSPRRYRKLRSGRHTFSVAAHDANGEDLSPARRTFTVYPRGRLSFGRLGGSAHQTRHSRLRARVFSNRRGLHGVVVTLRAGNSRGRYLGRTGRFSVGHARVVGVRLRRPLRAGRYVLIAVGRDRVGRRISTVRAFRLRR